MKLADFKVLTFDCYGTLIDWESGMIRGLDALISRVGRELSRSEILEAHARHESGQQRQTPSKRYCEVLAIVYRRLAEEWGVSASWEECVRYGLSVRDWEPFPDSVEALRYLKQHFRLVILSNVDNETFSASNARLGVEFDAIYTAEDIGSYKPADANFEYMIAQLAGRGFSKPDILHTAESMFHDHAPANRHGLRSCWIYRRHDRTVWSDVPPGVMRHDRYPWRWPKHGWR
jgi:2-haloalkanoic acid dehalogenase type II